MCHSLFLASSLPLPSVPWNEAAPGLTVHELEGAGQVVRGWLRWPEVYEIGSHTGCACPFILPLFIPEVDPRTATPDERQEGEEARRTLRQLADYLSGAQRLGAALELYSAEAYWLEPLERATLDLSALGETFGFGERVLYTPV